ncbi:MAG: 16S rRNA (uracil(1498)-N(3))-methyltransferase [Kiritimatiellaeota bacterium]|nr:16S rRNA (uracil(1498)-N(3))-methyltransferase [Kiritimatiellota bacterium]
MPDRFFVPTLPDSGERVELAPAEAAHAVRVLRIRPGTNVELLDGVGARARAEVVEASANRRQVRTICRVLERETAPAPALNIRVYLAPPRSKALLRIVRQTVELGVSRLSLVQTRYTVDRPSPAFFVRARAEAVAALKQSGNPRLPKFDPVQTFGRAIAQAAEPGYFGTAPDQTGPAPVRHRARTGPIAVWIGPEGGFAPEEHSQLLGRGLTPVTLGYWTLRVDTAVTALLGWLLGPSI